jgi:hypothetical protein
MSLFFAILIGALGTILIERQLRKANRAAIRVPVRSENNRRYRRFEN